MIKRKKIRTKRDKECPEKVGHRVSLPSRIYVELNKNKCSINLAFNLECLTAIWKLILLN